MLLLLLLLLNNVRYMWLFKLSILELGFSYLKHPRFRIVYTILLENVVYIKSLVEYVRECNAKSGAIHLTVTVSRQTPSHGRLYLRVTCDKVRTALRNELILFKQPLPAADSGVGSSVPTQVTQRRTKQVKVRDADREPSHRSYYLECRRRRRRYRRRRHRWP